MTDYTVITCLPSISQGTQYIKKSVTITETDENTKSTVTTETLTGKFANSKVNVSIGSVTPIPITRDIFITFFCSNQEKFDSNKQSNIYKFSPISYTKAKLIADGNDYYLDTKKANDSNHINRKWNNSLQKINFSEMEKDNNQLDLVTLIKDYYEKPFSDSNNNIFDSNINNYVGGIGENSTQNNQIIWCPFQSIKFFKKLYAISKKNLLHLKTYVSNPIDLSDLSDLSDDNNTVLINIQVVFKSNSTNTGIKEGETETTTANIPNLVLTVPISITK